MSEDGLNSGPRWDVDALFGSSDEAKKKSATFKEFAMAIQTADLDSAACVIGELLVLNSLQSKTATEFFYAKYKESPHVFGKVMQIRQEIQKQKVNNAMALVMECFGLDGLRALQAVENMKKFA